MSKKVEEFNVIVPVNAKKKFNVMKFNSGGLTDVQTWKNATLSRDLSARKQYETDLMMPEYGAGSEYGRRQKLEIPWDFKYYLLLPTPRFRPVYFLQQED